MRRRPLLISAAAAGGLHTGGALGSGARLRVGLTAVILADQAAFLSRWADYLGKQLGLGVSFFARESYQTILDLLFAGQLDAAWICGYPYVMNESRMRLLAVPLYQGQPLYQSYLIRSRHSKSLVRGWADLKGRVFAYSDPLSNSGWLVARQQMALAGVAVGDFRRAFFAQGHRNVAEAVGERLADAGAIDGYVWETMRAQGMSVVDQTEVVWKSAQHGFPPLITMNGAWSPTLQGLQRALMTMEANEEGRALLRALNLTGFIQGSPAIFDSIRQLVEAQLQRGVG